MTETTASLFAGAAGYYARYRAAYPDDVFAGIAARLGLDGTQRALDLGCGPGTATLPLAGYVAEVVAVDPEPAMLAEGRRSAGQAGVGNITFVEGDSSGLARLGLGAFDLALMAASFHWMDRPATLRTLDGMIRPAGAVVVVTGSVSGTAPDVPDRPTWADAVVAVRERWIPFRRRWRGDARSDRRTYGQVRREHRDLLGASAFGRVEAFEVRWERRHDVESLVGLQMTMPDSTPGALAERAGDFRDDLRAELIRIEPSGVFVEPIRTEVLIGRRE
ncbi:class I SAM-dependent methyltransferase [Micromonospora sp. NPDC049559]|uniref:class I SAM-dependent methyltransferase n=1 Tax=Micromonospora sp. NPDC049559 TaxID=3155923 RepID=UPI003422C825